MIRSLLFSLLVFYTAGSMGQSYPRGFFISPLDIPLRLSGNFGEYRASHFHSGIDLKTDSVEGKKVYAAADGYIARIVVSSTGFGKALYIRHSLNLMTVYAHLLVFDEEIERYVDSVMMADTVSTVDLIPDSNLFRFNQGDVIALSGNTGGSTGPHLHFEVRNDSTEMPMNPLLFGFEIEDSIAPVIESFFNYSDNSKGMLIPAQYMVTRTTDNSYLINTPVSVHEKLLIGFHGHDKAGREQNPLGIYTITLSIDDSIIFNEAWNTFSFSETRYVNAMIDYSAFSKKRKENILCFNLPCNNLSVVSNQKPFELNKEDTLLHHAKLVLGDVSGNKTVLNFSFRQNKKTEDTLQCGKKFYCEKPNSFKTKSVMLDAPAGSFYNDFCFMHSSEKKKKKTYSAVHTIHNTSAPVHNRIRLSIKAIGLPDSLKPKALLARVPQEGYLIYAGGSYEKGWVTSSVQQFGTYVIVVDTTPPAIDVPYLEIDSVILKTVYLKVRIHDLYNNSITHRAYLDGKFIPMYYDAKNFTLQYNLSHIHVTKESILRIEATDQKKNFSVKEFSVKDFDLHGIIK